MRTPTVKELAEIFRQECFAEAPTWAQDQIEFERGLRAVLDALQPVVAEAWRDSKDGCTCNSCMRRSAEYAASTIAQMKGESRD